MTDVGKIGQHVREVFVGLRNIRNRFHEGDEGELALMWVLLHGQLEEVKILGCPHEALEDNSGF